MAIPTQVGTLGNDTLFGANGVDEVIYGDTAGDYGPGTSGTPSGSDTIFGGAKADNILIGDAQQLSAMGHGGDDLLVGGQGGTNTLIGDAETTGGGPTQGGNDRLVSAANTTDHMYGDFQTPGQMGNPTGGQDTFVFGPKNGDDFIHDFHQGEDKIEFAATKKTQEFSDLKIQVVDTNNDGTLDSSVIRFGGNSVTVFGVTTLGADDFVFRATTLGADDPFSIV